MDSQVKNSWDGSVLQHSPVGALKTSKKKTTFILFYFLKEGLHLRVIASSCAFLPFCKP